MKRILFFDTETTGFGSADRVWQFAGIFVEEIEGKIYRTKIIDQYINPEKEVPEKVENLCGIKSDFLKQFDTMEKYIKELGAYIKNADLLVCHNADFDFRMMDQEFKRYGVNIDINEKEKFCTMKSATNICCIPNPKGKGYKRPSLNETHNHFFGEDFDNAHNALADIEATIKVFYELTNK